MNPGSAASPARSVLRVAFDASPLYGTRTGVGVATNGMLTGLGARDDIALYPYLISGRATPRPGHHRLGLPGRIALEMWSRSDRPHADRWLGGDAVDLVHGTNYTAPPTSHPSVISVYDCWFLEHPELANPIVKRMGRALTRAARRGAWIHVSSEATARAARRLLRTDRVVTVALGPPDETEPPVGAVSEQAATVAERFGEVDFVVAVGTEERRKGYPDLVRAFAQLTQTHPDVELVIAGQRSDDSDSIDAAVAELDAEVARRVVRLGFVDDETKRFLLGAAMALAYPSVDEGFGFPILEANTVGVPIVARSAGSIPEVAGRAAVLVDNSPTFVADFASALAQVISDDQRRDELIAAGHANVARFSWTKCADELNTLYHRALAEHTG